MPKATCSVDECDRPARTRGWCKSHYMWWYVNGKEPSGAIRPWGRKECAVEGCSNPHSHRDYCAPHMKRLAKGDIGGVDIRPRSVGDDADYALVHGRLKRGRGRAAEHNCVECGNQAKHWAYDHADPAEHHDPQLGYAFSLDSDHYLPMCVPCHMRFDRNHRDGTPEEVFNMDGKH